MYDNMEAVCWLCIPGNWNIFPSLDEMEYDRDSFQVNIAHQQNRVGASKIFELLYRESLERKAPDQSKDLEVSSKRSAPKSSIYRWNFHHTPSIWGHPNLLTAFKRNGYPTPNH